MGSRFFEIEVKDKIGHLVLSCPDELNTFRLDFWREFPAAVDRLSDDGGVRVLVVSSTGRHFTAGMDLSVFAGGDGSDSAGPGAGLVSVGEPGRGNTARKRMILRMQDALTALERARMPVLAAVQGGCVGGGLDLITACDMRYATEDAFFVVQETNIGITADLGTLQRLPKIIPSGVARELVYTGRRMSAARAREVGLVNEVYPDQESMLAAVHATAIEIATHSPLAVWGSKEMLLYSRDHSVSDGLDHVATWQAAALQTAEVSEAMRARVERRAPRYPDLPPVADL